jgi:hypothetical protein
LLKTGLGNPREISKIPWECKKLVFAGKIINVEFSTSGFYWVVP